MDAAPDFSTVLEAVIAALDADDHDAVAQLLAQHDHSVRAFASNTKEQPERQAELIGLQKLQLTLIELMRGRRDGVGEQLQSLAKGGRATRAYLSDDAL